MFQRVLVPLDGSRLAESVVEPVGGLVKAREGSLFLFHAVTPAEWFSLPATAFVSRERRRAAAYLRRIESGLEDKGIHVEVRIDTGEPSRAIVAAARREGADLIAMSSHGRSGVREWAFGSVAERVLRATSLPVLLFRGRPPRTFTLGRILVPLDGSERALAVLPAVCEASRLFGGDVLLVHAGRRSSGALEPAIERLIREDIPSRSRILEGSPSEAILEAGREESADLIALTTSGGTGDFRLTLGGVAEEVLRKTDRPLLLVRPGRKERLAARRA